MPALPALIAVAFAGLVASDALLASTSSQQPRPQARARQDPKPAAPSADPERFEVELVIGIRRPRAAKAGPPGPVRVVVPVPSDDAGQRIGEPRFTPGLESVHTDRSGRRFAHFHLEDLAPGELRRVGWSVPVALLAERTQPVASTGARGEEQPELLPYDAASEADLRRLARELSERGSTPHRFVQQLEESLSQRLQYVLDGRWEEPARVLRRGRGSCSEFSFLAAALARRAGYAARWVGGATPHPTAAVHVDAIQHRWVEVLIPGRGWLAIDPAARVMGRAGGRGKALVLLRENGLRSPLERHYVAKASVPNRHSWQPEVTRRLIWRRTTGDTGAKPRSARAPRTGPSSQLRGP